MRIYFVLMAFLGFSYLPLYGEENFILINGSTNEIIREFGPNIEERVTPASSFKIVLSLMGYDAGILQDEQVPTWHFQEGYDDFFESWKRSQTPQTWMNCSCIWFSKIIALQLGLETIEQYLSSFEYGNQDFSIGMVPPGSTNPAWVSSSLKISPKEQVEFIQKMIREKLLISSNALQMTKNLLFKEEISHGWELFGKTGLGSTVDENSKDLKVRWFVGWIESGQNFFPFAYLLQEYEIDALQTVQRVKQLLEESNLWNVREGKMQKELVTMPEIKLVGICVRTSNEQEQGKMKGNIFPCVQKYFH